MFWKSQNMVNHLLILHACSKNYLKKRLLKFLIVDWQIALCARLNLLICISVKSIVHLNFCSALHVIKKDNELCKQHFMYLMYYFQYLNVGQKYLNRDTLNMHEMIFSSNAKNLLKFKIVPVPHNSYIAILPRFIFKKTRT